ncbi:MAG TPA: SMP-30/gluconolactonase/LRE family protein [Actinospica sp.]|nr:SMP-30/gluconolactonase/LRE family protein [Actinospica sp.]
MTTPRFRGVTWRPPPPFTPAPRRSDPRTLPALTFTPLPGAGPEHVAADPAGRIVSGLADGRIVRIDPARPDEAAEVIAHTGGRPLGLEFDADGTLVVCDATRGLLRVTLPAENAPADTSADAPGAAPSGAPSRAPIGAAAAVVEVLCDEVDGRSLVFVSCPAIARDGTIYFTQSSQRHDLAHYPTDVLEHSGTGRILRHRGGRTDVIAEGLQFANGIVLTEDESALIVSETSAYRLGRHELDGTGRISGTSTLIDALPGFPDNLTPGQDGLIWIGMVRPRDRLLDALLPRPARLRAFISALPQSLLPGPKNIAWALAVDQSGAVVHDLHGWHVGFREVTAARQVGNRLYLGSLDQSAIAALELP